MIYQRLSNLSSGIQVFIDRVKSYNEALENSGLDNSKVYMDSEPIRKTKKKRRIIRKITFFNPPFCNR